MHGVHVAAHDPAFGGDVIGDDPVAAFSTRFAPRIGDANIVGFRGKADNQARAPDVRWAMPDKHPVVRQFERRRPPRLFLDLARACAFAAPIGHGSGENGGICGERGFDGVICCAVSTLTIARPGGSGRLTGPVTSTTSAPTAAAAAAMA